MKSENKFVFMIIFLISVNLIYYKIAKEIQKENVNIIKNYSSLNYQTRSGKNYSSVGNEEILGADFRNETIEFYFKDIIEPMKSGIYSTPNLSDKLEIEEIGASVNEGLLTVMTSHDDGKINQEPEMNRYYDEQAINPSSKKRESRPHKSHLISFLIILGILSFITMILVVMQEYEKRTKYDILNGYSRSNDGYYLLIERK